MDSTLNFQPSVGETLRDLELEVHQLRSRNAEAVEKLSNKIRSLEEALNVLIASNNLSFSSSRLTNGANTKLVLKNKTAPNSTKALSVVRNLLADNLLLSNDVTDGLTSAEIHGHDDILFDAGSILNKVKILARSNVLATEGSNLVIQNYN